MDNKTAIVNNDKIEISFPFDWTLINTIKEIQGRDFDKLHKCWHVPFTPWHSEQVISILEPLGFYIDPEIKAVKVPQPKVKIKLNNKLYDFQKEGVEFALKVGGRCIIADDMGLGKTITALSFTGLFKGRTLVIAPANVTYKWLTECEKWLPDRKAQVIDTGKQEIGTSDIDIMSYSIMVNKYDELSKNPYEIVIFDECLVKDTKITTPTGNTAIQNIKIGDLVASCNSLSNVVEYKKVLAISKKPAPSILYNFAGIVSTANHPVFTEECGYVHAKDISGYTVQKLREINNSKSKCKKEETVLFNSMFGYISNSVRGIKNFISSKGEWDNYRNKETRCGKKNEKEQSYVDAWSEREDDSIPERKNFPFQRRERSNNRTTNKIIESSRMERKSIGISDRNIIENSLPKSSSVLQGGYRKSEHKTSHRGGWEFSQTKKMEVSRQKENRDFELFRVDSVEVLERGSGQRYDEMCPDGYVYNIEVEGNNNYFANGILVHNCHYIKNSKAQRTRVAKALVRQGIGKVLFLSGTPFMNHPSELFPMLNLLDPVGFANYYKYSQRYCDARYEMGTWFFPPGGTSNLGELSDRLSRIMIRHTKQEVLKDLPDLTRTLVPVKIDNLEEYKMAVRDLKQWLLENDKEVADPAHVLTRLNVLRQIVGRGKISSAVELAKSVLQNDDRKVVLFAHHKDTVTLLHEALKSYGCLVISGDTPAKERQKNTNLFLIPNNEIRVMIITVAGAEGIDLFSASDVIFVEREWTPAREEQAEARLHRIGQKTAVTAWYLVAKHTVDEKLAKVVKEKREIFGQVIRQDEIIQEILKELEAK